MSEAAKHNAQDPPGWLTAAAGRGREPANAGQDESEEIIRCTEDGDGGREGAKFRHGRQVERPLGFGIREKGTAG